MLGSLIRKACDYLPEKQFNNLLRILLNSHGFGETKLELEVRYFSKLISPFLSKSEDNVILDIGANLGHWTKALLKELECFPLTFVLVEPQKNCADFLSLEFMNNRELVHILQCAVSSEDADVKHLCISSPLSGAATFFADGSNINHSLCENVTTQTLSRIISEHQNVIGVKLDVEGSEFEILSSAIDDIVNSTIRVIQFEFGEKTTFLRQCFRDFWLLFEQNEFTFYRYSRRGLIKIDSYSSFLEIHVNTVYFCIRVQ